MRVGIAGCQHFQPLPRRIFVRLFHQFAPYKQPQALVAIPLAKGQAGGHAVVRGNAQAGVGGFHRVDLGGRKTGQGRAQFLQNIVMLHAGQAVESHSGACLQPLGLGKLGKFGQAGSLVAGIGAEIASQLRHLGHGPHRSLGRRSRRTRREDDFGALGKGGGIPGQGGHCGHGHAQRKIFEQQAHALLREICQQFAQHRVQQAGLGVDGGQGGALSVYTAADVPLHQFAEPLQQRLLRRVARRSAVELAQQFEPVQGQPDCGAVVEAGGRVELPGAAVQHAPGRCGRKARFVHRTQHFFHRQKVRAEQRFRLAPGGGAQLRALLPEVKEGKALHQFHEG